MLLPERLAQLNKLEEIIGYKFTNITHLDQALTHTSYAYEKGESGFTNERLEFLGDVVLSLIISDYIYNNYSDYSEGALAKIRGQVVSTVTLAKISAKMKVGDFLSLGVGEEKSGGRRRISLLANTVEAIFGAMYLDGGLEPTTLFILNQFKDEIKDTADGKIFFDYKSQLQEIVQKRFKTFPRYQVIGTSGADHNQIFEVKLTIKEKKYGFGRGRTKKEAEQQAAAQALLLFTPNQVSIESKVRSQNR